LLLRAKVSIYSDISNNFANYFNVSACEQSCERCQKTMNCS
jgi:hypothetical protein